MHPLTTLARLNAEAAIAQTYVPRTKAQHEALEERARVERQNAWNTLQKIDDGHRVAYDLAAQGEGANTAS